MSQNPTAANGQPTARETVLLVDDNPNNLKLLSKMLAESGFQVKASTNGRFALQAAAHTPPDLILLDIMMPEMDGYEVCRRLKADPQLQHIPIIFISALAEADDKVKAFTAGGVDYISKPFQEAEVLARVRTHLTLRRTQQELKELVEQRTRQLASKTEEFLEAVDERNIVSRKLQTTEQNYRQIFNATSESIVIHDAETGAILDANQAIAEMFGYTPDEAVDLPLEDLCPTSPPYSFPALLALIRNTVTQGPLTVEWHCQRKDTTLFWGEVALKKSEIGGQRRVITVIRDISERKTAEQQLQASEIKYRQLFENSDEGMAVVQDGIYKICNPKALAILGQVCCNRDLNGFLDQVHPDDRSTAMQLFEQGKHSGEISPLLTMRMYNKNNEMRYVESKSIAIEWEGGTAALVFFSDITESYLAELHKKKLESQLRQSQKMEAIGTLAGGIAHDFNNILAGIFGYLDLAKLHMTKPEQLSKDLEHLSSGAIRARDLVRQILTFSRQGNAGIQPLQPHLVIKEALKLLRVSIPSNIDIQFNIPDSGMILADPTQIHQIVMNLCTNSYHAMKQTGGTLTVTLRRTELDEKDPLVVATALAAGPHLILEVSDTGIGMNKATMEKIFDPYFTTKPKGEGTGLGLSVTLSIVKNYGGHISVASELGQGATFKIFLPAVSSDAQDITETDGGPVVGGTEHIMVVDDDQSIVIMMKEILTSLGYRIAVFTSGHEALQAIEQHPDAFRLMITDMVMPRLTGVELAQAVREKAPQVKMILCTGLDEMKNDDNRLRQYGFSRLLMKPVVMRDLATTVREVLDEPS